MSPILNMPFLMLELFPSQRMIYENYRSTRIEEPPHRQHKHVSFVYTPSLFRIPHSAFRIPHFICYLLFAICYLSSVSQSCSTISGLLFTPRRGTWKQP